MAINIDGNNLSQNPKALSERGKAKVVSSNGNISPSAASAQKSGAAKAQDSVTLTESAVNFKKLEQSIASLPIVDMKKVEEIQKSIADGSYKVDSDKIAEKFIAFERDLQGL